METSMPTSPAPVTETKLRDPDRVLNIVRWIDDEPRKTGMKSETTGAVKFARHGVVLNKAGDEVTIPVIGTEKQWNIADPSKVEGYFGSKSNAWYFGPHPSDASVAGDENTF
jgi:hypothetical protein